MSICGSLESISNPTKSLAQVLFEASPTVGWQGSWHNLDKTQRRWWQEFAELACKYIKTHGHSGSHLIETSPPYEVDERG